MARSPRRASTASASLGAASRRAARTTARSASSAASSSARSRLETGTLDLGGVQVVEPGATRLGERQHLGQIRPVLAPQVAEQSTSPLHLVEALGILFPGFDHPAQFGGEIVELRAGGAQSLFEAGKGRSTAQCRGGRADRSGGTGVALAVAIEDAQCGRGRFPVRTEVRQPLLFVCELLVLVDIGDRRSLDLGYLVAAAMSISRARAWSSPPSAAMPPAHLAQCGDEALHRREIDAGELVEGSPLRDWFDEGLVIVLAVDVDKGRRHLLERAEGHHAPVDPGL